MAVGTLLGTAIVLLSSLTSDSSMIPYNETYSYSLAVGSGTGTPYKTMGDGHITAIRVYELHASYITGIQFQYHGIWSALVGRTYGTAIEMELRDGEHILQVSGEHYPSNYIYQLYFVTNKGRFLVAGQPTGYSFNFYPVHPDAELLLISGRYNGNGITSIGAHWGVVKDSDMH